MSGSFLVNNANVILKHMAKYPDLDFALYNLENDLGMGKKYVKESVDYLLKMGYIQEIFSTNLLSDESSSRISYKITAKGISESQFLSSTGKSVYESDMEEIDNQKKKFNRKVIIACAIAFAILIVAVIVVNLLNS